MIFNFVKIASKVLLTNPKAREMSSKVIHKAYTKAKPIVVKQSRIISETIRETSPVEDPVKFFKKLRYKIKKS